MESMRESWTDQRLDDFRAEVNRRFDEADRRFDDVNKRMNAGFDRLDNRLDGLHRMLLQAAVALTVGLLGMMAALIAVIAQV